MKIPAAGFLKAVGKLNGDPTRVLDLAGVRIVHRDRSALYRAVGELLADPHLRVVRYVDRFAAPEVIAAVGAPANGPDAWGPKSNGYRDLILICRWVRDEPAAAPVLEFFEVQLVTERVAAIMVREHPLYAWRRLIIAEITRRGRPARECDRAFLRACEEWSRRWYACDDAPIGCADRHVAS
ncbi:hypothetical protein [Nocardia sp. NPDC057668]|uniref:hypothetical protein n=1 Tax=Nocardia sp. NPDC057668 TaxID=3346202 RepID=UPI00366D287D